MERHNISLVQQDVRGARTSCLLFLYFFQCKAVNQAGGAQASVT